VTLLPYTTLFRSSLVLVGFRCRFVLVFFLGLLVGVVPVRAFVAVRRLILGLLAFLGVLVLSAVGMQCRRSHHVPLKVLELEPSAPTLCPPDVSDSLEEPMGVVLQDDQDASEVGCELMEGNGAVDIPLGSTGTPYDPLLGNQLDDL